MKPLRLKRYGVYVVSIIIIYLVLGLIKMWSWSYTSRVVWTTGNINQARVQTKKFKEVMGSYPVTLIKINQYAKENPKAGFRAVPFKEYFSVSSGNSIEHNVLNGQGGWYYNPNTGKLRVNLTKPLKHYMWFYFGKERNEIPADW